MGNNDPVSQRQFYKESADSERRILGAIERVNGDVNRNNVKLGVVETKLDTHEKRMDGQDDKLDTQKNWNRGLAFVEVTITALLVWVGIRQE